MSRCLLGAWLITLVTTGLAQTSATLRQTTCSNRVVEIVPDADAVIGGLFSIHSDTSANGYGCGPPISGEKYRRHTFFCRNSLDLH